MFRTNRSSSGRDVEWRIVPASSARKIGHLKSRTERLVERKEGFLMRRLLVALCALLALALAGPVMVSAQEATPEAGAGATDGGAHRYPLPAALWPGRLEPRAHRRGHRRGGLRVLLHRRARSAGCLGLHQRRQRDLRPLLRAVDAGPGGAGPAGLRRGSLHHRGHVAESDRTAGAREGGRRPRY